MAHNNTISLTIEEYLELENAMQGICKKCGSIRDCCEPDAEDYPCDECGENTVVGCDNALLDGMVYQFQTIRQNYEKYNAPNGLDPD